MSKCNWWLAATDTRPTMQCGLPTPYHYEVGDDGVRRRVHDTFCPTHQVKADKQPPTHAAVTPSEKEFVPC